MGYVGRKGQGWVDLAVWVPVLKRLVSFSTGLGIIRAFILPHASARLPFIPTHGTQSSRYAVNARYTVCSYLVCIVYHPWVAHCGIDTDALMILILID